MRQSNKMLKRMALFGLVFAGLCARAAEPKPIPLKADGHVVATYMAEPNPLKPYIKELFTPSGVQVLLDSPPDHVHHHGLMFGIGAGTTDFWAEKPAEKFGKQVPRAKDTHTTESAVYQTLDWIQPDGKKTLVELRRVRVYEGDASRPNLLTWETMITPEKSTDPIKLWGSHYFGLGLRLIPDLNDKVKFIFPAGTLPGRIVRGDERLTTASWCAAAGEVGGKPVTVALWEDPRYDPTYNFHQWFTMAKPFAYISATLDLQVHPRTINTWLIKRYGVAVFDGIMDAATIQKAQEAWMAKAIGIYENMGGQLYRIMP